jgi:hypothetical protein
LVKMGVRPAHRRLNMLMELVQRAILDLDSSALTHENTDHSGGYIGLRRVVIRSLSPPPPMPNSETYGTIDGESTRNAALQ